MSFVKNLAIFLLISVSCYADNWEDHWIKAVEYCEEKNYEAAEIEFNSTISILETTQDKSHPHVYVDRARLYSLLERPVDALSDLNIALESNGLQEFDLIRGLLTRFFVHLNLKMEDEALVDYNKLKATDPNFPKIQYTHDRVIIRNVPDCECYKNSMKSFLVNSEVCESENDIKLYKSNILVAKRKACHCGCKESGIELEVSPGVQRCGAYCDKMAIAGQALCGKLFDKFFCQLGCLYVVDGVKAGCYDCCRQGGIYQKCIKPYANFVERVGEGCDPAWD